MLSVSRGLNIRLLHFAFSDQNDMKKKRKRTNIKRIVDGVDRADVDAFESLPSSATESTQTVGRSVRGGLLNPWI